MDGIEDFKCNCLTPLHFEGLRNCHIISAKNWQCFELCAWLWRSRRRLLAVPSIMANNVYVHSLRVCHSSAATPYDVFYLHMPRAAAAAAACALLTNTRRLL